MWHSLTAQQVGYRLSLVAMFIRVVALFSGLGILYFYPHPLIAARTGSLQLLWMVTALYTMVLVIMLFTPLNRWLRSTPFLLLDTLVVFVIVNLAGGGYRNIFSLYSLMPSVTTALSLPDAHRKTGRAFLLLGVVIVSTIGYLSSLYLDGYTLPVIITNHQLDEVVLRSASYWVTGGLLGALAAMMIAWQYSLDRANTLRETAAVEEERRRIAADMHDGVLSQLSALSRRAEYAALLLSEDPKAAHDEMVKIENLASEIHAGIRWIVRALRQDPSQLTLSGELVRVADRFRRNTEMQIDLELPEEKLQVNVDAIRHLGYIVAEALANVRQHAGVDQARVVTSYAKGQAVVQVIDDGKGFDPGSERIHQTGMGLQNMRERAQEIGAQLKIQSSNERGTRVTISLPALEEH